MAKKEDFLNATTEHIETLKNWDRDLANQITANKNTLSDFAKQRIEAIDQYVEKSLPDLSETIITKLKSKFPLFLKDINVQDLIADQKSQIESDIKSLSSEIDAIQMQKDLLGYEMELEQLDQDLEILQSPVKRYESIPDFTELVSRGYSTPQYPHSFFSMQYHRDWKAGDEVLKTSQCKNWDQLLESYNQAVKNIEDTKTLKTNLVKKINKIKSGQEQLTSLKSRLNDVEKNTRSAIVTKFKSYIDGLKSLPTELSSVTQIDEKIKELQTANADLEAQRTTISNQLIELGKIYQSVENSRVNEVADKYVKDMKARTKDFSKVTSSKSSRSTDSAGRRSSSSSTTIFVNNRSNDDNWLLNMMIYDELLNDMHRHHQDHSSYNNWSNSGYNQHPRDYEYDRQQAENEVYGRSS